MAMSASQTAFTDPVTTWSVGPVNGINKDVSDARQLPMIVMTYPVD